MDRGTKKKPKAKRKAKPKGKSRPREERRSSQEVGIIVNDIVNLMLSGDWQSGPSRERLARQYGLAVSTIACYVTRASALVRAAQGDQVELAAETLQTSVPRLQMLGRKAEDSGDLRTAVQTERVINEVVGNISKTTTVNLTVGMLVDATGDIRAEARPALEQLMRPVLESIAGCLEDACGCKDRVRTVLAQLSAPAKAPAVIETTGHAG